jgi:hypothetical protein
LAKHRVVDLFGQAYRHADTWELKCPSDSIVTGSDVGIANYGGGQFVGALKLLWSAVHLLPTGLFAIDHTASTESALISGELASPDLKSVTCSDGSVSAFHLMSGAWLDALGIECGNAQITHLP